MKWSSFTIQFISGVCSDSMYSVDPLNILARYGAKINENQTPFVSLNNSVKPDNCKSDWNADRSYKTKGCSDFGVPPSV